MSGPPMKRRRKPGGKGAGKTKERADCSANWVARLSAELLGLVLFVVAVVAAVAASWITAL
jgi:hypothetical protein